MTHEYDKLPLWAQNHIKVLGMRLAEANAKIDTLLGPPVATDTMWLDVERERVLPRGAKVVFRLGAGYDSRIAVRVRDSVLDINAVGRILVQPVAGNCVEVMVREEAKP